MSRRTDGSLLNFTIKRGVCLFFLFTDKPSEEVRLFFLTSQIEIRFLPFFDPPLYLSRPISLHPIPPLPLALPLHQTDCHRLCLSFFSAQSIPIVSFALMPEKF